MTFSILKFWYNKELKFKHLLNYLYCLILDEAQEAEAVQVLNSIYDMREHQSNRQPEDMATVCHALAMLYFVLKDIIKVSWYVFCRKICLKCWQ